MLNCELQSQAVLNAQNGMVTCVSSSTSRQSMHTLSGNETREPQHIGYLRIISLIICGCIDTCIRAVSVGATRLM